MTIQDPNYRSRAEIAESDRTTTIQFPICVTVKRLPLLGGLAATLLFLAIATTLAVLFVMHELWLPAVFTVIASILGCLTLINLGRTPLSYRFDAGRTTVSKIVGGRTFRTDLLETMESIPGKPCKMLRFRYRDGSELILRQDRINTPLPEVSRLLSEHLFPASIRSPWPRLLAPFTSPTSFGPGCRAPFSGYLKGESATEVDSVEGICTWLQSCEYISDQELFKSADVWQHPTMFEKTKRGDCEDHALWAWRKLVELGIESEFVVGARAGLPHAWVTFGARGGVQILEASSKQDMIIDTEHPNWCKYTPRLSVNRYLVTFRYNT